MEVKKPIKNGGKTDRDKSGRFIAGNAGNRKGRGKGTRNRTTLAALALLEGESEKLTRIAVDMALAGDVQALRLCLERIAPVVRDRLIKFDLPVSLDTAEDVTQALSGVLSAIADGVISPAEGERVASILELRRKAIESVELERRITALEMEKDQNEQPRNKHYRNH